ncbi:hypothetical protein TSUD_403240 [Trifolium subterraneum]|uniref:ATP-dependent DNA helicase n=1 Tax=Trifolium subterraneum TaxID=3900 RepID=A0A2Z6NRW2_TRISU|nr:hypothetical protein TSUD_403240 [Trifolium subterraneum]
MKFVIDRFGIPPYFMNDLPESIDLLSFSHDGNNFRVAHEKTLTYYDVCTGFLMLPYDEFGEFAFDKATTSIKLVDDCGMYVKMTKISEITGGKIDFQLRVRVINLWSTPDRNYPAEDGAMHTIFLDKDCGKIHAIVKKDLIFQFKDVIEEGAAYVIERFMVAKNDSSFKTTPHKHKLNFMRGTSVFKVTATEIPANHFQFMSFQEILASSKEDQYLDVIGHVVEKNVIKETEKNGNIHRVMDATLEDLEIHCTLWGDFAVKMQQFIDGHDSTLPVIMVLQFGKLKKYLGSMGVSNAFYGTKLFLNGQIPEVAAYIEKHVLDVLQELLSLVASYTVTNAKCHELQFLGRWSSNNYPSELDVFVEKRLLFKVEVTDANLYRNWRGYTVKKVTDDADTIARFISLHGITVGGDGEDANCVDLVCSLGDDTPLVSNEGADSTNNEEIILYGPQHTPNSKLSCKKSLDLEGIGASATKEPSRPIEDSAHLGSSDHSPLKKPTGKRTATVDEGDVAASKEIKLPYTNIPFICDNDLNQIPCSANTEDLEVPLNSDYDVALDRYVGDNELTSATSPVSAFSVYFNVGQSTCICLDCGAIMCQGDIEIVPYKRLPDLLHNLYHGRDKRSRFFIDNIRSFNSMFVFTSMGGDIDSSLNDGNAPPMFVLNGENYHQIGSLLPMPGKPPKFAQLYIYDTDNEISNRMAAVRMKDDAAAFKSSIVRDIREALDACDNPYVRAYNTVRNTLHLQGTPNVKLQILGKRGCDGRRYNLPTASEVAALIVGDFDATKFERDVIVETQSGLLQRISTFKPSYWPLQYPLLFPRGEDGYSRDIEFRDNDRKATRKRQFITQLDTIESDRLRYMRNHQKDLRSDMYKGLTEAILRGDNDAANAGKRVVLPASFVGGARYMIQNYQDAMAILIYTIEFQKRGLPHAHILVFLQSAYKMSHPDSIDKIINAEIPDKTRDRELFEIVSTLMIHGPCGDQNNKSPCMQKGRCVKYFPKKFVSNTNIDADDYPVYRRRDNGVFIQKGEHFADNRFVVPYNRHLLLKYNAHINVEWCNQSRSIKYLFKYVNKGHDRVTAGFYRGGHNGDGVDVVDEIKTYYDCRYLSVGEAVWRIFVFDVNYREPSVDRLSFHLENEQSVIFPDDASIEEIVAKPYAKYTKFLAWMDASKRYPEARNLTYGEFPTKFVWNKQKRAWTPRKQGYSIGRLHFVPPGSGQKFYLRILLNYAKGPTCFDDIKTINNVKYTSFKEACFAAGLMDVSNQLHRPNRVWNSTWEEMSDDIQHKQRQILRRPDLVLNADQLKSYALAEIGNLLQGNGKTFDDYPDMPKPDIGLMPDRGNRLIYDELNYDRRLLAEEHRNLMSTMTLEQRSIYDKIMMRIQQKKPGFFFLNGYGGTGKTYIWRALSAALRSVGQIVLAVASSGIAALLIPGGRTAHSRFAIPLNVDEYSSCQIGRTDDLAHLIRRAKLIIWDEAPMMHRHCFEAVDRTLKDVMKEKRFPLGGKVVVLDGDFRQILHVIPKGTRHEIVKASINSSPLWRFCEVLRLTTNMRLLAGCTDSDIEKRKEFSEWILEIGDGRIGDADDERIMVQIPRDLLKHGSGNPLADIVNSIYPNLLHNMQDPSFFRDRAILAPKNAIVDAVNDYILDLVPGDEKIYLSYDSPCSTVAARKRTLGLKSKVLAIKGAVGLKSKALGLKSKFAVKKTLGLNSKVFTIKDAVGLNSKALGLKSKFAVKKALGLKSEVFAARMIMIRRTRRAGAPQGCAPARTGSK